MRAIRGRRRDRPVARRVGRCRTEEAGSLAGAGTVAASVREHLDLKVVVEWNDRPLDARRGGGGDDRPRHDSAPDAVGVDVDAEAAVVVDAVATDGDRGRGGADGDAVIAVPSDHVGVGGVRAADDDVERILDFDADAVPEVRRAVGADAVAADDRRVRPVDADPRTPEVDDLETDDGDDAERVGDDQAIGTARTGSVEDHAGRAAYELAAGIDDGVLHDVRERRSEGDRVGSRTGDTEVDRVQAAGGIGIEDRLAQRPWAGVGGARDR